MKTPGPLSRHLLPGLLLLAGCASEAERPTPTVTCAPSCACDLTFGCDADCACDPECTPCVPPEVVPPAPPPPPPPAAQLGAACADASACASGVCIQDPRSLEMYCSVQCEGPCPAGFSCDVLSPTFAACVKDPAEVMSGEITTFSRDGVFGYGPNGINLGWDYSGSDVTTWDFYHGPDADPALYTSGLTERLANVAKVDLADGVQFYWRVVGHTPSGAITSEVYTYTARENAIQGPCPDLPSVQVEGRTIETIEVKGRCWLSRDLTVGEDDEGTYLDDGRVQKSCMDQACDAAVYSWWEAHNVYETRPDRVTDSICPIGFRIPSRTEWEGLLALSINGLRGSPFNLELNGHRVPQNGDIESCPDPNNPMLMIPCVYMGSTSDTSSAYYWVNQATATTATRVAVRHEGGGMYSVTFGTPRPTFTAAVRCIRD